MANARLIPQVAVTDTPQSMDVTGENLLYDEFMIRLYLPLVSIITKLFDRKMRSLAKQIT
jgi:hypothetical protein